MNFNYLNNWFDGVMKRTEGRGAIFEYLYRPPFGSHDILVDLHGHTSTFSDGKRSVPFYKASSQKNQISHSAITDHDSIGLDDKSNTFINGVEITSKLDDNEIEILVYNYDQATAQALIDSGEFPYLSREFKILRNLELTRRRIAICNRLKLTDKPLTLSDILNIEFKNESGVTEFLTLSQIGINADHIIRPNQPFPEKLVYGNDVYPIKYGYLISKLFNCIHSSKNGLEFLKSKAATDYGFNPHSPDDFMKSIVANKNGELYIESTGFWPTVQEVIDFAKKTGGVAVLAHPFGYSKKINLTTKELLKQLNRLGIDGVEVFHGFNQSDEVEYLYKFCYENDMLITLGSDTHGYISNQGSFVEPGIAPGVGYQVRFNENNISQDYLSIYNLFYYGTGAWRGEKEFDTLSIPPTIKDVFKDQESIILKNNKNNSQPSSWYYK